MGWQHQPLNNFPIPEQSFRILSWVGQKLQYVPALLSFTKNSDYQMLWTLTQQLAFEPSSCAYFSSLITKLLHNCSFITILHWDWKLYRFLIIFKLLDRHSIKLSSCIICRCRIHTVTSVIITIITKRIFLCVLCWKLVGWGDISMKSS